MRGSKHSYTIIVGCGRLGSGLAGKLSDDGEDVMVIDEDKAAFRKLPASYGGLTMVASATDIDKLVKAEIEKADTVIAVTNRDNVNICAAQIAKKIFGIERVIARIYDEEKVQLTETMGIDNICPTTLSERVADEYLLKGEEQHDHKKRA